MPLLSTSTLLLSITVFHLTLGYYLLASPSSITDQSLVLVLGAAMNLPSAPAPPPGTSRVTARRQDASVSAYTAATGLAGLVLLLLGLVDFASCNFDFGFAAGIQLGASASGRDEDESMAGKSSSARADAEAEKRTDAEDMRELKRLLFWSLQALFRLAFFIGITGWSYGMARLATGKREEARSSTSLGLLASQAICNSLVFTWGFVEMLIWFYVYQTAREEKRVLLAKRARARQ